MTARKRTGLWDMVIAARTEANRIRFVQKALVGEKMLEAPHAGEIAKADAFDDIADLLRTIIPVKDEIAAILAPIARGNAGMAPEPSSQIEDSEELENQPSD